MTPLILTLALMFEPSPSPDVARYECIAKVVENEPPRCSPACAAPVFDPNGRPLPERFPVPVDCEVSGPPSPPFLVAGVVRTPQPVPGTLLMFAVRAVDGAGNASAWVGGP